MTNKEIDKLLSKYDIYVKNLMYLRGENPDNFKREYYSFDDISEGNEYGATYPVSYGHIIYTWHRMPTPDFDKDAYVFMYAKSTGIYLINTISDMYTGKTVIIKYKKKCLTGA